jgi:hypothetical protein
MVRFSRQQPGPIRSFATNLSYSRVGFLICELHTQDTTHQAIFDQVRSSTTLSQPRPPSASTRAATHTPNFNINIGNSTLTQLGLNKLPTNRIGTNRHQNSAVKKPAKFKTLTSYEPHDARCPPKHLHNSLNHPNTHPPSTQPSSPSASSTS